MPEERKELLRTFVNDQALSRAVHLFLQKTFLKAPKNRDVQSLAAAWMAKDTFEDAWKELINIKNIAPDKKEPTQIGL